MSHSRIPRLLSMTPSSVGDTERAHLDARASCETEGFMSCDVSVGADAVHEMQRVYPSASQSEIEAFCAAHKFKRTCLPAKLLIVAATKSRWDIVHSIVEHETLIFDTYMKASLPEELREVSKLLGPYSTFYNGNLVLSVCAYFGNLTIVKYLLERKKMVQFDDDGLRILSDIFLLQNRFLDSFWILEAIPLSNIDFADACGRVLNKLVYDGSATQIGLFVTIMRSRGGKGEKLLDIYTSMHTELIASQFDAQMTPLKQRLASCPMASMASLKKYAAENDVDWMSNPDRLLYLATVDEKWDIVHTLLKSNVLFTLHALSNFTPDVVSLWSKPSRDLSAVCSDVVLLYSAFKGQGVLLSYLLSLPDKIQRPKCSFDLLPFAALKGGHSVLAAWLFRNLSFSFNFFDLAAYCIISYAIDFKKVDVMALYLHMAALKWDGKDFAFLLKRCIVLAVDDIKLICAIYKHLNVVPSLLIAAAEYSLQSAASQKFTATYTFLHRFISLATLLEMPDACFNIYNVVTSKSLVDVKAQVLANADIDDYEKYLYYAMQSAINCGFLDIFEYLLSIKPASLHAVKSHITELLVAVNGEQKEQFFDLILTNYPCDESTRFVDLLEPCVGHFIAQSRVHDVSMLLNFEKVNAVVDDFVVLVLELCIKVGDANDLSAALPLLKQYLCPDMQFATISFLMNIMDAYYLEVAHKITQLVLFCRSDSHHYALALRIALQVGAQHNLFVLFCLLDSFAQWPSAEDKLSDLTLAASEACKNGNNDLLVYLLKHQVDVPRYVRLTWEYHPNTFKTVLKGISCEELMSALSVAAVSLEGPNVELCVRGILSMDTTPDQQAELTVLLQRRLAFQSRRLRAVQGILESEFDNVAEILNVDSSWYAEVLNNNCAICYEPLIQLQESDSLAENSESISYNMTITSVEGLPEVNQTISANDTPGASAASSNDIDFTENSDSESGNDVDPIYRLKCPGRHTFHYLCINEWFGKSRMCPICKFDFNSLINPVDASGV